MTGPLHGLRVLEIAGEFSAYPGKVLADLGANVVVVEPPGGSATRGWGPFAGDLPAPEASLHWRHYNTSKRSVLLDLGDGTGRERFRVLLADCDVLLEGLPARDTGLLTLDPATFSDEYPSLVWVSVTPFGRRGSPPDVPATDLTLMAGGGPVHNCGYDDHTLPPVRGGGGQSAHVAGSFAVTAALTALLHRAVSGRGQHVDVSVDAALNVSSELATTQYLTDGGIVERQTGRHAMVGGSAPTQVQAADGHHVVLGFPPRAAEDYASIVEWVDLVGLRDEFPDVVLLELGAERGGVAVIELATDPLAQEIWNASRDAMVLLAQRLPAYDFFLGCQRRGIVAGFVASPEEAVADPHLVARGFATEVTDPYTGRVETHPGAPYRFNHTAWCISRPAPRIGEHTESFLKTGWNED
ncbi:MULTISPECIES: CaiB/BaiF CoA-transferase family protein [unclassified Pseudofrankia]|uniref:CaiB/BaiF CoA transferase family protein n=1 Tax=unclassified Pseudofrankia TaxID=2994372 RepID=UPI0008DA9EB1|nr:MULTISPECIES: CoA transferase [unclassified Pseudofrankia]MDT3446672.1 CoA transferase [Pseudofrankia sp. BMG5.37]OHV47399.1 carnitine dehydratase [Pseudofrankia sp. BMG5.36]